MKNLVPKKLTNFVNENKVSINRINKTFSESVKNKYLKSGNTSSSKTIVFLLKTPSYEKHRETKECSNLGEHRRLINNCKFNHSYDFNNSGYQLEEIFNKKVEENCFIMKEPITMKKPEDIVMGDVEPVHNFFENYPTRVKSTIESFILNIPENNNRSEKFKNEFSDSFSGISNIYRKRIISLESQFKQCKTVLCGKVKKVHNNSFNIPTKLKPNLDSINIENKGVSINKSHCCNKLNMFTKLNGLYSEIYKAKSSRKDKLKLKTLNSINK